MQTRGSLTLIAGVGLFLFAMVLTASAAGAATRVPVAAELLPVPRRFDGLRLPAEQGEAGRSTVGLRHRLRRRLRRATAEALSEHPGRQLRLSRRVQHHVHARRLRRARGRRQAARRLPRIAAQGGAVVSAGSPRRGKSGNRDAVGRRPGSAVAERQARTCGDRVVRDALRLDPAAAPGRARRTRRSSSTGAWNPEADRLAKTEPLYRSVDAAIARAAAASRVRVANMFAALNGSGNVRPSRLGSAGSPTTARRAIRIRPTRGTARWPTRSWLRRATRGSPRRFARSAKRVGQRTAGFRHGSRLCHTTFAAAWPRA